VSQTIENLSFVERFVWPLVGTLACDFILCKFARILGAISPKELALAMKKPVFEFSLEFVPFSKLTTTMSMVYFADLELTNLTCPFFSKSIISPVQFRTTSSVSYAGRNVTLGSGSSSI